MLCANRGQETCATLGHALLLGGLEMGWSICLGFGNAIPDFIGGDTRFLIVHFMEPRGGG